MISNEAKSKFVIKYPTAVGPSSPNLEYNLNKNITRDVPLGDSQARSRLKH